MSITPARATTPYLPTASVIVLVIAVLGNIIDVILAKNALDVVLNESEFLSAVTAVGIALVAVGAAVGAGLAIRRRHRALGSLLMTAWLLIGIALTYMRWNKGTLQGNAIDSSGVLDGAVHNDTADRVLAIIMLAVFVAAGIEIAIHGSRLLDTDSYFRVRSARRAITHLIKRRTAVAAQYGRVSLALREFDEKRARAERQHNLAQNTIDAIERELMAFTRDRIAEVLGTPETTGLIRQPLVTDVATQTDGTESNEH